MTPYMILNNLNDWHLEPKHQKTKCFQGGGEGGRRKGTLTQNELMIL